MDPTTRLHLSPPVVYTTERSHTPGRGMAGKFTDSAEDHGVPVVRTHGSFAAANTQGTALGAGSVVIDPCLSRIFVAAYLLTGNAEQAEAVASESIQQLDISATRDGRLSWKTLAAAILQRDPGPEQMHHEAPMALPVELQRVLRLPPRLRQCFVLRVLMAMPRHYCAGLLHMGADQVEANSSQAAQVLASIVTGAAPN